ncbi:MAG: tetratricopeptide repeat protein [Dissulfurispiraceae bacterium]|jgi:predicted negative regulator of RcsB-dependent stress response|nr:tetratricopeptide repeat protein [Dissulfurispiraceae bacterium]
MPKIIKKRISHSAHDHTVQESIADLRDKFKEKQKLMVTILAGFIVVLVGIIGYLGYNSYTANKALEFESEAYKVLYADFQAQPIAPEDRIKKAIDLFKKSYDVKKKAHVLLMIANCYYELGDYDETIKKLLDLTDRGSDPLISPLARYKMAMTYIKKDDKPKAFSMFATLSSLKEPVALQDLSLLENARLLDEAGKAEEAKAKYNELITRFPHSPLVEEAKKKLAEK